MGDLEVGKRGLERAQMFGKSRQLLSGTEAKEQGWVGQQIKVRADVVEGGHTLCNLLDHVGSRPPAQNEGTGYMGVLKRVMKVELSLKRMGQGAGGAEDHHSQERAQICGSNLRLSKGQ